MPQQEAGVIPFQPWTDTGHAEVAPLPPSPANPCVVPLEHRSGDFEVRQEKYSAGLVLVPTQASNQLPDSIPATLPLESTSARKIKVNVGGSSSPNGVVVLFTSRQ